MPKGGSVQALGFWMCTALVVGNMIGSGVFLLPASLAPYGWNAIVGWVVTIAGGLCLAGVFATLSRRFPREGGPYVYTREAFGRSAGFVVAWSYWISLWVGNAAIAAAAVSYLAVFAPGMLAVPMLPAIVTCAVVWLFTAINLMGVRWAGGVQVATTALKLLPLAAVALIAVIVLTSGHAPPVPPLRMADLSLGAVTASAALTLWALLGLESATVPADRVKDPTRTIPRATMVGTVAAGVIYLVVCAAVILLMPADQAAASNAPLADFVARYWPGAGGGTARLVLAAFAAISALGALNGWIMLQGEMPYAMARDGVFPRWLARLSPRGVPVRAHLVSSSLLTVLVLMNGSKSMADLFTFIILLATNASLIAYLACALALLKMMHERKLAGSTALAAVGVLGGLYALGAMIGAGSEAALWGFVLLLVGGLYHLVARRIEARRPAAESN